ncbi:Cro/C1-type helix-turn-helix DNA-binding protein [Scopulibacillus darangshiensis]|uniref:Cro/C1-type helix-turn-helix DNA-binding protein n=1 Tax=Scopulibacillus darangshiensis TaxID=442528 RepID=A0A4R2P2F2_9BACL|nr:helix-turn-helix transcriptional regulator [Scopulibacillus darangshiensis]TCP28802.1 Cro/C1-type helix-turn-helix DNA-binding protein [Scopulibacillus darangshiensis]
MASEPKITFKLEEVLKEKGVGQTEMADSIGIRRGTITAMKKSDKVNIKYLAQIMQYLELESVDEILEYTPAEKENS